MLVMCTDKQSGTRGLPENLKSVAGDQALTGCQHTFPVVIAVLTLWVTSAIQARSGTATSTR